MDTDPKATIKEILRQQRHLVVLHRQHLVATRRVVVLRQQIGETRRTLVTLAGLIVDTPSSPSPAVEPDVLSERI